MAKRVQVIKHSTFHHTYKASSDEFFDHFSIFKGGIPEEFSIYSFLRENFRTDFFTIVSITKGTAQVKINFNEVTLTPGDLMLVSPNNLNQYISSSDGFMQEGVSFTSSFLKDIPSFKEYVVVMEFFTTRYKYLWKLSREEQRLFSSLIDKLQKRYNNLSSGKYGKELLFTTFTELLLELGQIGEKYIENGSISYGRKEELIIKFSRLAMKHHTTEKKLSFYSKQLFVTSKYLSEVAKQVTGRTAGEMIDELDVLEAKRLLESTDMDITEISSRLNFGNPAFFSRFFKRMTGFSPRNYRNRNSV